MSLLISLLYRCLSRLPLSVLYLFATLGQWLLYHLVRYRRAVVHDNLRHAFPAMDRATRQQIERDFTGTSVT